MREAKTHWVVRFLQKYPRDIQVSVCGIEHPSKIANAKRKVTCKSCLKAMGVTA